MPGQTDFPLRMSGAFFFTLNGGQNILQVVAVPQGGGPQTGKATTLDCTRKFRNFWGSSFALRRLSDRLCLENGLSIVENPKPRSKGKYRNYGEWQKERKCPLSYQDRPPA